MPEADFTPEFQRNTTVEFNRLKLKVGEKARIVMLERPTFAWTHTLRGPKLDAGQPVMTKRKRKGSDEEIVDYDLDFIGRPQCLGDYGILADAGIDPVNCPACKRAKESEEVYPPERRFAVNVIRYATGRDDQLVEPFSCTCLVWTFPEGVYNKLFSIAQEHDGLPGKDLILGPCEVPEAFQRYPIVAGARHVWNLNEQLRDYVVQTWRNNRVDNLELACGRAVEARWMRDDLQRVADRWRDVATYHQQRSGVRTDGTEAVDNRTLTAGLNDLLAVPAAAAAAPVSPAAAPAAVPVSPAPVAAAAAPPVDMAALLSSITAPSATPAPAPAAPTAPTVASAPPPPAAATPDVWPEIPGGPSAPPAAVNPQPPSPTPSPVPPSPPPAPPAPPVPPAPPAPPPMPSVAPAGQPDMAALLAPAVPTAGNGSPPPIDFAALLDGITTPAS